MTYMRTQPYTSKIRLMLALLMLMLSVVLTMLMPYGWLALFLIGLTLLLTSVVRRPASATTRPVSRSATASSFEPRTQTRVLLKDGNECDGLLVPMAQEQEWKLVLTRNGYVLVDQHNQQRHTLS